MGLGKTVQTLAALQQDRQQGNDRPNLLVCPTSVINNWQREAARFTPDLPVLLHHGSNRHRGVAFRSQAGGHHLVVTSYGTMHRDQDLIDTVPWRAVILDEAQNIKNPASQQARTAQGLQADYRIALTGTPVENHVGDLWSIMQFLNPGLLGSQAEFKRNYFQPIQNDRDGAAAARLQKATGPFILRRLKTDRSIIDDLPDKNETKQYCNLTREQATLYQAVLREAETRLESAEGMKRRGSILDTLTKLKQACNHPRQLLGDNSAIDGRSGKLVRLQEILEEVLTGGDRVLVFSQFAEMGAILQQHVQETYGLETPFLHGGVTQKQRDLMVERFQDDPDGPQVFVLSLKAGGLRTQPAPGQPRDPLRPLVEPGRGKPGHRPGLPHRPDQGRPRPQADLRRHAGGPHRPHDRNQAGDRRPSGGSLLGAVAHRALQRRAPGCAGPQREPGGLTDGTQPRLLPRAGTTMSYNDYLYTKPIEVRGGIRAGSKRGAFGSSWWARRWLQTLEEFQIGSRLDRGRSYARRGQVMSIDIQPGGVTAKVQGSRKRPYNVSIEVRTISPPDWERLQEAMAEQPIIAASLLSGRMPDNIEDTFRVAGLSMFPDRQGDLETDCSCPDWSNPCKHVAAVYLLLGEEFDRDPFLIFRMRGMEREDLLGPEFRRSAQTLEGPALPAEPLPPEPGEFWANPLKALREKDHAGPAVIPDLAAALPQQLGRFPLWQGNLEFVPAMQDIYRAASQRAVEIHMGPSEPHDEPAPESE